MKATMFELPHKNTGRKHGQFTKSVSRIGENGKQSIEVERAERNISYLNPFAVRGVIKPRCTFGTHCIEKRACHENRKCRTALSALVKQSEDQGQGHCCPDNPIAKKLLFQRKKKRIRLQIDRTIVKGKFNVLMVAVSRRGRALPLVWTVLSHTKTCSHPDWQPLLKRVDKLLSRRTTVVLLGDRECGTTDLIRFCRQQGWYYVLRAKHTYTAANPHEGFPLYWMPLASLLPFRNMPRWIEDWLYIQDEFVRTNIALTCAPDRLPQPSHRERFSYFQIAYR